MYTMQHNGPVPTVLQLWMVSGRGLRNWEIITDVAYLQVTLCDPHLSTYWSSYTDDRHYTSPLPFLSFIGQMAPEGLQPILLFGSDSTRTRRQ